MFGLCWCREWKATASIRVLEVWGKFITMPDANKDSSFDTITGVSAPGCLSGSRCCVSLPCRCKRRGRIVVVRDQIVKQLRDIHSRSAGSSGK